MKQYIQELQAQNYRWMQRLKREPFNIAFTMFQPLMWLLLFSGVFKRVTDSGAFQGNDYTAFLTPGTIALTVFGNSMSAGIPILFDKEYGFLSRLLVAPISRSTIILSRFLFINILSLFQVGLILALAWFLGVTVAGGPAGIAMIFVLATALGMGITALSLALAFVLRSHVEYFAIIGFCSLPLLFISTALAPVELMQGWLQIAVQFNPMTYAVDGMRYLVLEGWSAVVVLEALAILLVFDTVTIALGTAVLKRRLA